MRLLKRIGLSRREFARMAAVGAAVIPVFPSWSQGADPAITATQADEGGPEDAGESTPSKEAEALGRIVRLRYGRRVDRAMLREITRRIDGTLKGAAALREVPLTNADEPAFIFRVWRGSGD